MLAEKEDEKEGLSLHKKNVEGEGGRQTGEKWTKVAGRNLEQRWQLCGEENFLKKHVKVHGGYWVL